MDRGGLGAANAAVLAASAYGVVLISNIADFGAAIHQWEGLGWTEGLMLASAMVASALLGRRAVFGWLKLPRLTLHGLLSTMAGLALALASAMALGLLMHMSDARALAEFRDAPHGLLSALLALALLVPLLEEWLFRGVMLECMLALFPKHAAVVVTALLFAILHLSPQTVLHHGLLGYVCGRVRVGSDSLWPAIACHALYNAVVTLSVW